MAMTMIMTSMLLMRMILRMMVSLHTAGLIHGILRIAFTTTSSDKKGQHKKANTESKPTSFYTQKASRLNASFQKQFRQFLHQAFTRKFCTKRLLHSTGFAPTFFPAASFSTEENMHEVYTSRYARIFYPCLLASTLH